MLLAGMGKNYVDRHNFATFPAFRSTSQGYLDDFKNEGIEVREYDPTGPQGENS